MPGMDSTGPLGTGPIGRGMGPCGGGQFTRGFGRRGFARRAGFGRGAGFGWGFSPTAFTPVDEKVLLDQQKSWLETQLDAIKTRLENLEEHQKDS